MQLLCTDCRYLTNWMFVQARRQSWSLPSQDLPFPILADKPNNLSIILIILADENSKHLIVIICTEVVTIIRLTCWTSSTPILEPWYPVFHPRFNMFNKPIFRDLYHIWHLGIFPETDNLHIFLIFFTICGRIIWGGRSFRSLELMIIHLGKNSEVLNQILSRSLQSPR